MNNTRNSAHIVTPLKALWRWLMDEPGQILISQGHASNAAHPWESGANTSRGQALKAQPCSNSRPVLRGGPLRVLRVLEAGQTPAHVGRMRISGRMADVCAELDRLAAHEAMLH